MLHFMLYSLRIKNESTSNVWSSELFQLVIILSELYYTE